MRDLPRLETILKEIKKAISIPLTVKIRAGYYDSQRNAVEVARLAEACGAEHIALARQDEGAGLQRACRLGPRFAGCRSTLRES